MGGDGDDLLCVEVGQRLRRRRRRDPDTQQIVSVSAHSMQAPPLPLSIPGLWVIVGLAWLQQSKVGRRGERCEFVRVTHTHVTSHTHIHASSARVCAAGPT